MMNKINCIFTLILAFACSSCAISNPFSFGKKKDVPVEVSDITNHQLELVSRDFVTAISKLRGYSPRETTIQFYAPDTLFEQKMHDAMRGAGYGIQVITEDETSNNLLTYVSDKYETSESSTVAYEVSIGRVTLGREYEIRTGRVFPITALAVKGGTKSTSNKVDNDIFNTPSGDNEYPEIGYESILINPDARDTNPYDIRPRERLSSRLSPIGAKQNMADIGGLSNYESLFGVYIPVSKKTLVFGDDSLRLGKANKKTIMGIVQQFNPETDVISVIGCSHGKTNIANGNALLANGRASRVKEELIMANVEPDKILDEGCWTTERYKDMPPRGVLLTLRSKSKTG